METVKVPMIVMGVKKINICKALRTVPGTQETLKTHWLFLTLLLLCSGFTTFNLALTALPAFPASR